MEFTEQVVVVTGGGGAIGRAIALAFAAEGAAVVVADVSLEAATRVVAELAAARYPGLALRADVTLEQDCGALVSETVAAFGRLDVLVNNAGIGGLVATVADMDLGEWNKVLAVNVTGAMLMSREGLKVMLPRRRGNIVNMASNVGKRGMPTRSPYVASKFAMIGLTQCLALELAPAGIRVNAVCPGPVEGPRIDGFIARMATARQVPPSTVREEWLRESPMRRMVTTDEVAAVTLFLASPRASAMTGQAINVTAGRLMY